MGVRSRGALEGSRQRVKQKRRRSTHLKGREVGMRSREALESSRQRVREKERDINTPEGKGGGDEE